MTDVLGILQLHRGKANAITGKELARLLGYTDDRGIRAEIRGLIARGHPIASTNQPPYGFYMAESIDEAEHYLNSLKSRLIEDAYRRRDFKKAYASAFSEEKQLALL